MRLPADYTAQRPGEYVFTLDRGSSEYIYNTKTLAELPGRALHQKRNHISAFTREHSYEYLDYTPDMLEDCMLIQRQWLMNKGLEQDEETAVIRCALENYVPLGLRAAVIKTEGAVSYTHLDVYKRQGPRSARIPFCCCPCPGP